MSAKKINKRKVFDILTFVGILLFFLLALTCAILKHSGASFIFGKTRYDVVLTDSMSEKNPKFAEFLEGHDDQYQRFDLVKSKKVNSPEELKVYDVVIYKDPNVGNNMHRIVSIKDNGYDSIDFKYAFKGNKGEYSGVLMNEVVSTIETSNLSFYDAEFSVFTTDSSNENRYNFNIISTSLVPEITKTEVSGGTLITYKLKRETAIPGQLHISHKFDSFDYSKDLIISLKIELSKGSLQMVSDSLVSNESDLHGEYNKRYLFEIRGDKSEYSDGFFNFEDIESKVVKRTPKLGHLFRFLESFWGIMMFVLLGAILLTYSIVKDVLEKKKKLATSGESEVTKVEEPKEVTKAKGKENNESKEKKE